MCRIRLVPFILEDNFTTSGEVWIIVKCHQAPKNITVNINDIEVLENSVKVIQLHPKEDHGIQVCVIKGIP
jgi:predicted RNA-binding protein associated with RNAse of E/G family